MYRPEIDGLRAVAIFTVLLFHFFPTALPLGYLGVDVFFAISGYLITHRLLGDYQAGQFSFLDFYHRRIKRILPASLFVLIVTSVFAIILLTPPDLRRYGQSLLAALTYTANFFFWRSGGYFGATDELKPLLHMWSLSVEEQFYLVFPFAIVLLLKWVKSSPLRWSVVLGITVLSFAANAYLIQFGGANPSFFMLPTRAWQFSLGTLAAMYHRQFASSHRPIELALACLALCGGFIMHSELAPAGLVVSLATAFFLAKNFNTNSITAKFFLNSAVRKLGIISFSVYLWHWPIVVFIKYHTVSHPPIYALIIGILLTLGLSLLSYRFIEQPFRKTYSSKAVYTVLGTSTLLLLTVSGVIAYQGGNLVKTAPLVKTISEATQTIYRCPVGSHIKYGGFHGCRMNQHLDVDYDLAVVGNSHGLMYVPSVQPQLLEEGRNGLVATLQNCLPTIDINISSDCLRMANANYKAYMEDKNIKTMIIALTWYAETWVDQNNQEIRDPQKMRLAQSLLKMVRDFESVGKRVFLVGPIEIPKYDLSSVLSRELKFDITTVPEALNRLKVPRRQFDETFSTAISFLHQELGSRFLMPHEVLCDAQDCHFGREDMVYFSDSNHLGRDAAIKLAPLFREALQR